MSIDLSKETAESDAVEVKVEAEGDDVKIDETIILRKLPALQVVVKEGVFDWSESAKQYESLGNMIYDVILDGKRVSSVKENVYKASTGVTHVIAVRPRVASDGAFYYSDWSAETQATVLSAPIVTDVRWNVVRDDKGEIVGKPTANIVWTSPAVTSQATYEGTINGIEFTTTEAALNTSTVEGLDIADGFAITLKAKSTVAGISDSSASEVRRFISLASPKNLYISDGILHFDSVKNAATYNVIGRGGAVAVEGSTETNYFVLNNAAESFTLTVVARPAEGYEAPENPSETISFNVLSKPSLRYEARSFFIGGNDDNVADYNVLIKKEVKNESGEIELVEVYNERQGSAKNIIFNQYDFKTAGRYYLTVKAISAGNQYMDSAYSDPYEVVRLDTIPGLTIEEIPTVEKAGENHSSYLRVVIQKVKENAELVSRYQLFMDNSEVSTSHSLTFDIPAPTTYDEKQYKFSVRTVSDDDGSDSRVILSSFYSVEFIATKMNTPRDIALNENGSVSWNMPASNFEYLQANGDNTKYNNTLADYQLVIAYSPITVDASLTSTPFPATLSAGRYYVSVYARSAFSKNAISNKNKPVELRFSVTDDGATISKSYDVENAEVDLPIYREGEGEDARNYSVIVLSSDYSDSVPMVRLPAPVADDVVIRNNILIWGAIDGAEGYDVYYSTTVNGEAKYGLLIEGCASSFFKIDDIENDEIKTLLASDTGCAINIVARGNRGKESDDGIVYSYDSVKSENVYVFKLEKVTGITVNDDYLTWTAVSNATGYNVYDGEGNVLLSNIQATRYPSVSVTDLDGGVDEYELTIVALGDGKRFFNSDRSDMFKFLKLDYMGAEKDKTSATGLLRYGDLYIWEPIAYTTTYSIEIDGKLVKSVQSNDPRITIDGKEYYYYKPTFTTSSGADGFTVRYWANASNGLVQDWTKYGYEAYDYPVIAGKKSEFKQIVKEVEVPEFVNDSNVPNFALSSTYRRFYVTANVNDAPVYSIVNEAGDTVQRSCTYMFRINGQNFRVDSKDFTYDDSYTNEIQPGPYTVTIAYGANFFAANGDYIKDGPHADTTFEFTFLRGFTDYDVSLTGGSAQAKITMSWSAIEGATGYKYYYVIYKKDGDEKTAVCTSEQLVTKESNFTFVIGDVLGASFDPQAKYYLKAFVVTLGDNVQSVTAYDVIETEYNSIS